MINSFKILVPTAIFFALLMAMGFYIQNKTSYDRSSDY